MLSLTLFFYGFLAGCAGLLGQVLFLVLAEPNVDINSPTLLFIGTAALLEESAKLLFLLQSVRRFSLAILTVPRLICFGLGFAIIEFGFAYFLHPTDFPPFSLLALNALFHVTTSLLLGWGLRKFSLSRVSLGFLLLLVSLSHLVYNLLRI